MLYSMNDLVARVGKSKQAIYALFKHSQELSSIVKEQSSRQGNSVKYSQVVLDYLIKHYQVEEPTPAGQAGGIEEPAADEIPKDTPPDADILDDLRAQVETLKEENARLQSNLDALTADLERERTEKQEIMKQHSATLMLFAQEKAEKQRLLPPPRKPIFQRITDIFSKKRSDTDDNQQP